MITRAINGWRSWRAARELDRRRKRFMRALPEIADLMIVEASLRRMHRPTAKVINAKKALLHARLKIETGRA